MDLGTPPDAGACLPSGDYFVSDVWPRFVVANHCADRLCHDFVRGHGTLRFRVPEAAPAPGAPTESWPLGWRENYLSTIQFVRCDDPPSSRILSMPEGVGYLHPPGPVIQDRAGAAQIIESWVAAPR